jgi:hypothetical protein
MRRIEPRAGHGSSGEWLKLIPAASYLYGQHPVLRAVGLDPDGPSRIADRGIASVAGEQTGVARRHGCELTYRQRSRRPPDKSAASSVSVFLAPSPGGRTLDRNTALLRARAAAAVPRADCSALEHHVHVVERDVDVRPVNGCPGPRWRWRRLPLTSHVDTAARRSSISATDSGRQPP